jgi:hypothetical protein
MSSFQETDTEGEPVFRESLSQLSSVAGDAYTSARDLSGMLVGGGVAAAATSISVAGSTVTYDDSSATSTGFVEMRGIEVQDANPEPVRSYKVFAL